VKKRIIITGDRNWKCDNLVRMIINDFISTRNIIIVHGDCPTGVDRSFKVICTELSIDTEPHPALWSTHGKQAGPIRNAEMARLGADYCIAFHQQISKSKGTKNCVEACLNRDICVYIVTPRFVTPRTVWKNDKLKEFDD
jgi:hypothetical protein